jgi:hypothetical protein
MAQVVNQFSRRVRVNRHIEETLKAFNDFADSHLHHWRSKTATDGVTKFLATSTRETSLGVEVQPRSFMARIEVAMDRNRHYKRVGFLGKRHSLKRRVGYFYKAVFTFSAVSATATDISYELTEEIDHNNALEEDLTHRYSVPSLPDSRDQIGERFLEFTRTLP